MSPAASTSTGSSGVSESEQILRGGLLILTHLSGILNNRINLSKEPHFVFTIAEQGTGGVYLH